MLFRHSIEIVAAALIRFDNFAHLESRRRIVPDLIVLYNDITIFEDEFDEFCSSQSSSWYFTFWCITIWHLFSYLVKRCYHHILIHLANWYKSNFEENFLKKYLSNE